MFDQFDNYSIYTTLSLKEIIDLFHEEFDIGENTYNSIFGTFTHPYYGIFSKPNKFVLKRRRFFGNPTINNVIDIDIYENEITTLNFKIKDYFPKIVIMFLTLFFAIYPTILILKSFNFINITLAFVSIVLVFILSKNLFRLYLFWQKKYFEKILSVNQ